MGEFSKWLLHEDQKELFDFLFAITLNIVFLALTALLLWPLGRATMSFRLAKGYVLFWIVIFVTAVLLAMIQQIFRVDLYSHSDAYVFSALALSGFLQAGWSAFAALTVHSFIAGTSVWLAVSLYAVGVVSCYVACVVVGAFYMGHIYKLVNLLLAFVSFAVFSVWPASGRVMYGWFFDLF